METYALPHLQPPEEELPPPPEVPPVESAWERGLRHAKEVSAASLSFLYCACAVIVV